MRVDVEQRLRRGHQRERFGLVGRTLVGRVEAAHAVDLVAEEVEAKRQLLAGGEQVDQRAAHRIFAMLRDRVGALVAERVQLLDQRFALDPLALGNAAGELADAERRQHPLRCRAGGRDEQLRLVAAWPGARSSVASRSAMTRRAGEARSYGRQSQPGSVSTSTSGANSGTVSASARIAASSATIATARPPLPLRGRRARDRRRATAGSRSGPRQASEADRREGRAGAARSSRDPDIVELLQRVDHRTREALRRLGGSVRPGHDVDVLLLEHRLRTARARCAPHDS